MSSPDKALETQLRNIETRTGKSLEQLHGFLARSGLSKHGELRDLLKRDLVMGHGDANTLVHMYLKASGTTVSSAGDPLDAIYSGGKAHLRPIHDRLMSAISRIGPFETAPKKAYVSLRRKKQFAMIGPATQSRVEVGLNMKDVPPTPRLRAMPPGGMCQYKVHVTDARQVDTELVSWIRQAYDRSG